MSAPGNKGAATPGVSKLSPTLVPREVVRQLIMGDLEVFRTFVGAMHTALTDHVESRGTRMTVSEPELFTYLLTAVRTRTYRAAKKYGDHDPSFHIRTNSMWCLPSQFATIVNKIGVVELNVPRATFVPMWNVEHNEFTYSRPEELVPTTQRLRSLADHPDLRLTFIEAMASNETGDEEVLAMIPLRDELGRIREVRGKVNYDGVSASVVFLLSMVNGFYSALDQALVERIANLENPYAFYGEEMSRLLTETAWRVA